MRRSWVLGLCTAGCLAAAGLAGAAEPAIRVENHVVGSKIRYPVPLLTGTVVDKADTSVEVFNQTSPRAGASWKGVAHLGRFKALAELVPGTNSLLIKAGAGELRFSIDYEPQTNPYLVRTIFMTDSTGETAYQTGSDDDPQDYAAKLSTAMKLLQTFTAERLHDLGYGRRTFNLEWDGDGAVRVHILKGRRPAEYYYGLDDRAWYAEVNEEVKAAFPGGEAKNVVIVAYTRFDPATKKVRGHTALGGGDLGLFGSGDLSLWPSGLADAFRVFGDARSIDAAQIFDDSAGRGTVWGAASTTLGATLHELGHAFGLPHCRDPQCIMTRGFDRLNREFTLVEPVSKQNESPIVFKEEDTARFAPISAAFLRTSRWFALDKRVYQAPQPPAIGFDEARDTWRFTAVRGLRYVGFSVGGEAVAFQEFRAEKPVVEWEIARRDLNKRVGSEDFVVRALDDEGAETTLGSQEALRSREFVREWQFAGTPRPWTTPDAFPVLTTADISEIVRSARESKPVAFDVPYVDFLPSFPKQQTNVAGYALRVIDAPRAQTVRLRAGSDDALRIWLNGAIVHEKLALRAASIDDDTASVSLKPGENILLVEVSQRAGGWGLYLRLEDEAGRRLQLARDGTLAPLAARP